MVRKVRPGGAIVNQEIGFGFTQGATAAARREEAFGMKNGGWEVQVKNIAAQTPLTNLRHASRGPPLEE